VYLLVQVFSNLHQKMTLKSCFSGRISCGLATFIFFCRPNEKLLLHPSILAANYNASVKSGGISNQSLLMATRTTRPRRLLLTCRLSGFAETSPTDHILSSLSDPTLQKPPAIIMS